MVRGLYTAWTRTSQRGKRMDVVTNNMANADTTGYKKVDVTSQSFDRQLAVKIDDPTIGPNIKQGIGGVNLGVKIGETYYDMSQGNFRTDRKPAQFGIIRQRIFYHQHNRQEWNDNDTLHARWRFHCNQGRLSCDKGWRLCAGGRR